LIKHLFVLILGLALLPATAIGAATEEQRPAQVPAPAAAPQQQLPVPLEQALYLIRSTLLTLNDANRTGNYTVLRDLASPTSRRRTPPPICPTASRISAAVISIFSRSRSPRHSSV
jgi:hypothetical protein